MNYVGYRKEVALKVKTYAGYTFLPALYSIAPRLVVFAPRNDAVDLTPNIITVRHFGGKITLYKNGQRIISLARFYSIIYNGYLHWCNRS